MSRVIAGTENFGNGAYIMPTDDDTGNSVFADLETMLERLATHSHTGFDSKSISLNFTKLVEEYLFTGGLTWVSVGNGIYRATIVINSIDANYYDNLRTIFYKDASTNFQWEEFNPRTELISANSYYIYSNDNGIELRTVYY